jgi:hypothetical protein
LWIGEGVLPIPARRGLWEPAAGSILATNGATRTVPFAELQGTR